jgi:hypothetical protein
MNGPFSRPLLTAVPISCACPAPLPAAAHDVTVENFRFSPNDLHYTHYTRSNSMKYISVLVLTMVFACPAQASNAVNFRVTLSGDDEVPPVMTDTSGSAILHVDSNLSEIRLKLNVNNGDAVLGAAGSHFHCGPAGENGPVVAFVAGSFPPGYDGDFEVRATLTDASIINPACGASIMELVGSMLDGNVYLNVHSTDHPGGVIRGQVQ